MTTVARFINTWNILYIWCSHILHILWIHKRHISDEGELLEICWCGKCIRQISIYMNLHVQSHMWIPAWTHLHTNTHTHHTKQRKVQTKHYHKIVHISIIQKSIIKYMLESTCIHHNHLSFSNNFLLMQWMTYSWSLPAATGGYVRYLATLIQHS